VFFRFSLAKFAWSALRRVLGCNWCPASFAQFHAILSSFSGLSRRLLWVFFLAQSWALWLIRNKLTIERKVINHPADVLYKSVILLQLWSSRFKGRDKHYKNRRRRRRPAALGVATPGPRRRLRRRQPSAYRLGVQVPRHLAHCRRRRPGRRRTLPMPTVRLHPRRRFPRRLATVRRRR
jgi:hypothetical protein